GPIMWKNLSGKQLGSLGGDNGAAQSGNVYLMGNTDSTGSGMGGFNFINPAVSTGDKRVALVDARRGTNQQSASLNFFVWNSGTFNQAMIISQAGLIQIKNYGAGTLTTDASGNVTAASDERLKDLQGSFVKGLDSINGLNPITYKWKSSTGFDTENIYAGFSAQNVQNFIPEAVGVSSDGYLTLQDRPILAALVNAIKETSLKMDAMSSSTAILSCADAKCLVPAVNSLNLQYKDLAALINENVIAIENQKVQLGALEDEIIVLRDTMASATSTIATTTGSILEQSATFIAKIADSVMNSISSTGNWVIARISATYVYSKRIEAETVAISQGLEMKDQATGLIYCVVIKNGDWERKQGTCAEVAASSASSTSVIVNTYIPSLQNQIIDTSTTTSIIGTATIPATNTSTTTSTITSTSTPVVSTPSDVTTSTPVVTDPTVTPAPAPTPTPDPNATNTNTTVITPVVVDPVVTSTPSPTPTPTPDPNPAPTPSPAPDPTPVPPSGGTAGN
ncbi:MAG: tail fiber domain-containing protein, partial [bacterium]